MADRFVHLQYYKPWLLRPEEEDIIQDQIAEAERIIAQEEAEFERRYPPEEEGSKITEQQDVNGNEDTEPAQAQGESKEANGTVSDTADTVGATDQHDKGAEPPRTDPTSTSTNDHDNAGPIDSSQPEASRGHEDEVVEEDKEDTVIY